MAPADVGPQGTSYALVVALDQPELSTQLTFETR
jgi:hypothetical protein